MRGPYPGELRRRVIGFVEAGGSRREAAEQFDIGVSSAIGWMQRFREDGTCEPMPRGGSTSPLEEYAEQILALNREQPDPWMRSSWHCTSGEFLEAAARSPDFSLVTALL
jgi:transposase